MAKTSNTLDKGIRTVGKIKQTLLSIFGIIVFLPILIVSVKSLIEDIRYNSLNPNNRKKLTKPIIAASISLVVIIILIGFIVLVFKNKTYARITGYESIL